MHGVHRDGRTQRPLTKGLLSLVALLVLALAVAACDVGDPEADTADEPDEGATDGDGEDIDVGDEPEGGGTLVIGSEGEHEPLDPHVLTGTTVLRLVDQVYDTLVSDDLSVTADEEPYVPLRPGLAEEWDVSDDGLTYTFHIREGVEFHDGEPLDADAVDANFQRAMDPDSPYYSDVAAGNLDFVIGWIDETTVVDEYEFEIQLSEPFPSLPRNLNDRRMSIVSPAALEEHGDDIGLHPVGTGPFMVEGEAGSGQLDLVANEDYWDGAPLLDGVIFDPIPDSTTLASNLQTGAIDVIMSLTPEQIPQFEADENVNVEYADLANLFFWMLNTQEGPTSDPLVRQALNYAVDRESIVELLNGAVEARPGAALVGNPVYDSSLEIYEYDLDRAQELLEEADVETPIQLSAWIPTSGAGLTVAPQVAAAMQENFREIGVEFNYEFMEFAAFLAQAGEGLDDDTAALYTGWTTGAEDPYWYERMFASDQVPPSGVNRAWFDNAEVDGLLSDARSEVEEDARVEVYREAAAVISEEAPWIFLYQDRWPRAISTGVEGFVSAPSPYVDLTEVTVSSD